MNLQTDLKYSMPMWIEQQNNRNEHGQNDRRRSERSVEELLEQEARENNQEG